MSFAVTMGPPLAVGLALALLAGRRGWAPPLWAALAVGAALRVFVMLVAAHDPAQPYDFDQDFPLAGDSVLRGENPAMHVREGGWHFLPLLAYVLAGQIELGQLLGLSWNVAGRIVPVLADLALIPLVARLAGGGHQRLRAFQYACVPLGVMVSAVHGQFPPITLLFGVAALVCARSNRVHAAGLLIGLSVACTNWSVLLVPGVVLAVAGARSRLTVLGWTAGVPAAVLLSSSVFLDTPLWQLPTLAKTIMSTRPVVGDWGWTSLATGGGQIVSPTLGRIGMLVLLAGLVAAAWWWRGADPIDLTVVLLLVFLVLTHRLGAQYLLWPLPYLIARQNRWAWPAIIAATLWAAFGYLRLYDVFGMGWWAGHMWWAWSSFLVIPLLLLALPWRRRATASQPAGETVTKDTVPAVE
ncbi:hypothetical protein ITP53_04710 [Nonomuraea sp. K274]|uniref:Uncharacterized protein n=1 Tax=Nonomuraea cypriaca TaxID=1187855 RepID=A0A931A5C7_9ACTN|nr:hypothetical protein [Nonomuraea cypriaca]MBF8185049.1 hypothetical protein [Nonomuraea cypriaca]